MALSEYEKRVLAEMEQHLRAQDPKLADKMASTIPSEDKPAPKPELSPRKIAMGSILAAGGLGVVLLGVTLGQLAVTIILGVMGFVMMVAGVLIALSAEKASKNSGSSESQRALREPAKSNGDKQAERRKRWENR